MTEQNPNPPQYDLQNNQPRRNSPWGWLIGFALIIAAAIVIYIGWGPVNTGTAANNDDTGSVSKVESEAPAEDNTTSQNGFAGRNVLGIPATPTPAAKVYTEAQVQATVDAEVAAAVEQRENELLVPSSAQPEPTPTIRVEKAEVESSSNRATVLSVTTTTVGATTDAVETGTETSNGWAITWYAGATHQMRGQAGDLGPAWPTFPVLDPAAWPDFPNVDNPRKAFPAAHGLEYGEDESQHCGAADDLCSIVIPPMSYVLMSGNSQNDLGACIGSETTGCAWGFVNVGLSSFELHGWFDNVFIIQGRYWHGDFIPDAIVGGLSHVTWNMVNGASKLNPADIQNAGGNCSSPNGCDVVLNQLFITSGAELLIYGATAYRP